MRYRTTMRKACGILVAAILSIVSFGALAVRDIVIDNAAVLIDNDIIMLNLDATFEFSADALAALESGIELFFDLDIRIVRARRLLWNAREFETSRRFSLERHALSNQFILTDLVTDERRVHGSLDHAIADLGRIRRLPVVETTRLPALDSSIIGVRFRLDIDALPAPMIPLAYVSPGWHMSSGWVEWPAER
jgi:hypothetical protein